MSPSCDVVHICLLHCPPTSLWLYKVAWQARSPYSLPDILIVNCCIQREADLSYWCADGDHMNAAESCKSGNSGSPIIKVGSSRSTDSGTHAAPNLWLPFRIEITVDSSTSSVSVTEVCMLSDYPLYPWFARGKRFLPVIEFFPQSRW